MPGSEAKCIMWMLSIFAGLVGFAMIYFSKLTIPLEYGVYASIAALAGLDAVVGGFRAAQEQKFQNRVFVSGFLVTTILAVALTWFGERIGVEIGLAAVFVFVQRIMNNLSIVRRSALLEDRFHMPHLSAKMHRRATAHAEDAEAGANAAVS